MVVAYLGGRVLRISQLPVEGYYGSWQEMVPRIKDWLAISHLAFDSGDWKTQFQYFLEN